MGGLIRSLIGYSIIIALILLGFRLYKSSGQVTVNAGDRSMMPSYGPGTYKLDASLTKVSDLKPGDVVAYWLNGTPSEYRVGRVVALEGDRTDVADNTVKVNGSGTGRRLVRMDLPVADLRIPRGCVFIVAEDPSMRTDSLTIGPVHFSQILGRVAPSE